MLFLLAINIAMDVVHFCGCRAAQEIAEAEARGEELVPLVAEPTLLESLEDGISRLSTDRGTWKVRSSGLLGEQGGPIVHETVEVSGFPGSKRPTNNSEARWVLELRF